MLKFLRKYSKALLVFFGVFLMVAFLMPTALQELIKRQSMSAPVMTVAGKTFTNEDAIAAEKQLRTLTEVTTGIFPVGLGISDQGDHWVLAREEAGRAGFYGGVGDSTDLIREAAELAVARSTGLGPQNLFLLRFNEDLMKQVDQLATAQAERRYAVGAQVQMSPREVDLALAAARGVARYQQAYATAPRVGMNRVVREARKRLDQAEMQVLFIGVDPNVASMPDPAEAELLAHFNQYREKVAGVDDSPFGYRHPRRYRLEYFMLDRAAIEKAVKVSPVEVQKRLLDGASKEVTDAGQRRAAVESTIRSEAVARVMSEATMAYKASVLAMVNKLAEEAGYKVLSPEWTAARPAMASVAGTVAQKVSEVTGMSMPTPVITSRTDAPVREDDLAKMDIWQAIIRRGNSGVPLRILLANLKELRADDTPKVDVTFQAGVPFGEPLEDRAGNRYFVNVTEALPEAPAASIDEVRVAVINDAKKAVAYTRLAEQVAVFETVAGAQGFDELVEQLKARGGVTTDIKTGVRVSANSTSPLDSPANDKNFREIATKRMALIDPTLPLDKASPTDLVMASAVPTKLGVAVGKITAYTPATLERFRASVPNLLMASASELVGDRTELLNHDQLAKRLKVEYADPRMAPKPVSGDKPAAEKKPAAKPADKPAPATGG